MSNVYIGNTLINTSKIGSTQAKKIYLGSTEIWADTDTTPPSNPVQGSLTRGVTSITLSWTASTDNVAVTGYEIWRNKDSAGYSLLTSVGSVTTYEDTNTIVLDSVYAYKLKAVDAAGNKSGFSNEQSLTF